MSGQLPQHWLLIFLSLCFNVVFQFLHDYNIYVALPVHATFDDFLSHGVSHRQNCTLYFLSTFFLDYVQTFVLLLDA